MLACTTVVSAYAWVNDSLGRVCTY